MKSCSVSLFLFVFFLSFPLPLFSLCSLCFSSLSSPLSFFLVPCSHPLVRSPLFFLSALFFMCFPFLFPPLSRVSSSLYSPFSSFPFSLPFLLSPPLSFFFYRGLSLAFIRPENAMQWQAWVMVGVSFVDV